MYMCNSCRLSAAERDCASVPAGEVAAGLGSCGFETPGQTLPRLTAADQVYSSGFCPGCALEKGTMFPELVSEYGREAAV